MKNFFGRVLNSEFLTFNEVLRLKVTIVTIFLFIFVVLSIPTTSLSEFTSDINLLLPISFMMLLLITIILLIVNKNRTAMHFSIFTIISITIYYLGGSDYFYGFILFFVALTIIIFYQDIYTYLVYGGAITIYGLIYINTNGLEIMGANSASLEISNLTYQSILLGFYIVFLIQFIMSDNIYENLNNEYVRMNKVLEKYHDLSMEYLKEILEKNDANFIYDNLNFQQTISELSVFVNEFFEEDSSDILEAVEFYFFIHDKDIDNIVDDKRLNVKTRKHANEFKKYLLNNRTEMVSMLFEFSTLFQETEPFNENRYEYNINNIFYNKVDKLLAMSFIYKFLRTEKTQYDKWGKITESFTHEQVTELFVSREFREFLTFEQVNFYLDNQELFDEYLT